MKKTILATGLLAYLSMSLSTFADSYIWANLSGDNDLANQANYTSTTGSKTPLTNPLSNLSLVQFDPTSTNDIRISKDITIAAFNFNAVAPTPTKITAADNVVLTIDLSQMYNNSSFTGAPFYKRSFRKLSDNQLTIDANIKFKGFADSTNPDGGYGTHQIINLSNTDFIFNKNVTFEKTDAYKNSYNTGLKIVQYAANVPRANVIFNGIVNSGGQRISVIREGYGTSSTNYGKTIFKGSSANQIYNLYIENSCVVFSKTAGVSATQATAWNYIEMRGGRLDVINNYQFGTNTSLQLKSTSFQQITLQENDYNTETNKIHNYSGSGTSQYINNIFFEGYTTTTPDIIAYVDFGLNADTQLFSFGTLTYNDQKLYGENTGLHFLNYEIGVDRILSKTKVSDKERILDMIFFDDLGVRNQDYWITENQVSHDNATWYEYSYSTEIPEPAHSTIAITSISISLLFLLFLKRRNSPFGDCFFCIS